VQDDVVHPPSRRSRRTVVALLAVVGLAAAAFLLWNAFFARHTPDNLITLSGRVEGDDSAIAPKTSGRIREVRFREGDYVHEGDTIAVLDSDQLQARVDQAAAALSDAEASMRAAREQIGVLQEQQRQNELQAEQARIDAEGRVRQADAEVAAAESDLAQQQAAYSIAEFDRRAYERLAATGAASERQGKQAAATASQQAAAVAAAKRRVEAARGAVNVAKATLRNPPIRQAGTAAVSRQITQQRSTLAGAMARADQARAQLREAEANRQDLIVRAPFDGTVITRAAEPGEVVTAGTAIVTLLDLHKLYLRGFVPQGEIGSVKLGQPARVYLDANPDQPIDAYVQRIDPQATFTPENTYFREERVKQVVGVKLQLKNAVGYAKPGMPADGEILIRGDAWPETRRRE
jgi:HlyD family secretion protein